MEGLPLLEIIRQVATKSEFAGLYLSATSHADDRVEGEMRLKS